MVNKVRNPRSWTPAQAQQWWAMYDSDKTLTLGALAARVSVSAQTISNAFVTMGKTVRPAHLSGRHRSRRWHDVAELADWLDQPKRQEGNMSLGCQRLECGRYPQVTVEHTTCPNEPKESVFVPGLLYEVMDLIVFDAARLYRAVAEVSKTGPRELCFETEVLPRLDWPHEVMHVADVLEQQGWLRRARAEDGSERWTPLGRDLPRGEPIVDLVVPPFPAPMRAFNPDLDLNRGRTDPNAVLSTIETDTPYANPLSEREQQMMDAMAHGVTTNEEIAKHLSMATETVKTHFRRLYAKLHVKHRCQAFALCLINGWVNNGSDGDPPELIYRVALFGKSWTDRKRDVFPLLAAGYDNAAMAAQLGLSADWVKTLIGEIIQLIGARDRYHVITLALQLQVSPVAKLASLGTNTLDSVAMLLGISVTEAVRRLTTPTHGQAGDPVEPAVGS